MLTTLLTLASLLLAVLGLAKDWGAHGTTLRRALVILAIIVLAVGGLINTHYANLRTSTQHMEDQKRIANLESAVSTANENQRENTKQFVQSFNDLTDKLSKLEVQVKTADLKNEAAKLRTQLEATQKALSPPKAKLEATVGDWVMNKENLRVKEVSVQAGKDGTVAFSVTVVNKSDVQARDGSIRLRICQSCAFVEEPERFRKIIGAPACDREFTFTAIAANTGVAVPLKIKPPPSSGHFEIGVQSGCENCEASALEMLIVKY